MNFEYYHVIRSSNTNLTALETAINTILPNHVIRPRMTTYTRAGRKRRPKPVRLLMYPGYAFINPDALHHLAQLAERWTHHFLRSPANGMPVRVPVEQVDYARELERRSMVMGKPLARRTRVVFTDETLNGLKATVQECKGHVAIVWPDGGDHPITCLLTDISPIKEQDK